MLKLKQLAIHWSKSIQNSSLKHWLMSLHYFQQIHLLKSMQNALAIHWSRSIRKRLSTWKDSADSKQTQTCLLKLKSMPPLSCWSIHLPNGCWIHLRMSIPTRLLTDHVQRMLKHSLTHWSTQKHSCWLNHWLKSTRHLEQKHSLMWMPMHSLIHWWMLTCYRCLTRDWIQIVNPALNHSSRLMLKHALIRSWKSMPMPAWTD